MIHMALVKTKPKGWFLGPWNSRVPIPVGYANRGIDEKHLHKQMFEVYMVANGTATVVGDKRARGQDQSWGCIGRGAKLGSYLLAEFC